MKKALIGLICASFLFSAVCGSFLSAGAQEGEKPEIGKMWAAGWDSDGKEYNDGDGKPNYLDTQGQHNFYYWYASHADKKSTPDKLKLCVPGDPLTYPNITAFMPEESDIKEVNDNEYQYNCEYFSFTDWGAMSGSSGFGKINGFDPAIQFQAPVDGRYEIEVLVGGGIRLDEYGDRQIDAEGRSSDGVIWRLLNNSKNEIFKAEFTGNATKDCFNNANGNFKQEFDLRQGQGIYLLLDQIENSICDDGYFSYRVKLVSYDFSDEPEEDTPSVDDTSDTKADSLVISPLLIVAVIVTVILLGGMVVVLITLKKVLKKG